jgi:hypothetical protein
MQSHTQTTRHQVHWLRMGENDLGGSAAAVRASNQTRGLSNVRFGSRFGLKSDISRGPSCAMAHKRP